jgi:RNA polymerase sigma-70 factor (ECF subfamily)
MLTQVGRNDFPTTSWTLVVAAGDPNRADCRDAIASLCAIYWYPLYAFIRRRGHDAPEAQDLVQEFFARFLAGRYFDRADPEKGNFRAFLLTCLKCFLADEKDRDNAQKRGGGVPPLPFEIATAESLYTREPAHNETPERIYERRWARALLDSVHGRLRDEFVRHGRLDHFNHLKAYLVGNGEAPYADLSAKRAENRDPPPAEAVSRPAPPGSCRDRGRPGSGRRRTPFSCVGDEREVKGSGVPDFEVP